MQRASEIYRRTRECLTNKKILCNIIVAEENYSSSATMSSNTLIKSWIFWIRTFLSKIVFFRFTNIRHVSHLVDRIGKKERAYTVFLQKVKEIYSDIYKWK